MAVCGAKRRTGVDFLRIITMRKNIKLVKGERDVLKSAESSEFVSVASKTRDIAHYSKVAKMTSAKNKTIAMKISGIDLMKEIDWGAPAGKEIW